MGRVTCIKIPIAGPVPAEGEDTKQAWAELRKELAQAWAQSTAVANAVMLEFAKRDVTRTPEMKKIPPMAKLDVYRFAREVCPELHSNSVNAICRDVEKRYRANRFEIVWLRNASHMNYKYPYPVTIRSQACNLRWLPQLPHGFPIPKGEAKEDEHKVSNAVPYIVLTLWARGNKPRRWALRLKSGPDYRRQMAIFRQAVSGDAKAGQVSITQRDDGQIFACIPVTVPETHKAIDAGVMVVRTHVSALLIAKGPRSAKPWIYPGDEIRRRMTARNHQRKRENLELKRENRLAKGWRKAAIELTRARNRKLANRLDSFIEMAVAATVSFAKRNRCGTILYDDTDRRFFDSFRWFDLNKKLQDKSAEHGIKFVHKPAFDKDQEVANELLKVMFEMEDSNDVSCTDDE